MVTVDDARSVASTLPRSYEAVVRDRVRFRVGRIVYVAFSRDETVMGFAFPKGGTRCVGGIRAGQVPAPSAVRAPLQLGLRPARDHRLRRAPRARRRCVADMRPEEGRGPPTTADPCSRTRDVVPAHASSRRTRRRSSPAGGVLRDTSLVPSVWEHSRLVDLCDDTQGCGTHRPARR